ncbi:hypothetical protein HYY69_05395 [Candidatus Woesearchaeota archaeon]|nr:hypothetical protein [Candidatus Woesearchaeota archaeon]
MKKDYSAIKAIVAILIIVIIMFIVIKTYSKTTQQNAEITGNVVYDWHYVAPDQSKRTNSVGFYQNTAGNQYSQPYGVDYDATEWDSKRPVQTESKWGVRPKYVDRQGGFNYNFYPTNTDKRLTQDHNPQGKVYLQRTYNIYPEIGEINFVIDLYDEDGVGKLSYDVFEFEPGYGQNHVSSRGKFSLDCNLQKTCKKSYIFARKVHNFFQIFEPFQITFFYRDGNGNIREGVLNAQNKWSFTFE